MGMHNAGMCNDPQPPGSMRWRKSTYSNGHSQCVECAAGPGHAWRKSSHSYANGNCAEVTVTPGHHGGDGGYVIAVRDSKNPAGPVLTFDAGDWQAFINRIKSGPLEV